MGKEKENENLGSRILWGSIILMITLFIGIIGYQAFEERFPSNVKEFELEEFENINVKNSIRNWNFDHPVFRITDYIQMNSTITNKIDKDLIFEYTFNEIYKGKKISLTKDSVSISAGKSELLIRIIPFNKTGLHYLEYSFELYEAKDGSKTGYVLEQDSTSLWIRVLSESDFQTFAAESNVFKFLGFIAAPLVIISIKYVRDILQNR